MSDLGQGPGVPGGEGSPARRRGAASVTLRQSGESVEGGGGLIVGGMDPATKSLADALRITYRLLLASMVVLAGLYVLSGLQSVKESERAVRLLFGRVEDKNLAPGFQWSYPAPIGELVKVQTGLISQEINNAFFPALSDAEEKQLANKDMGAQSLADGGSNSLNPDVDGQLLTADGSIVHARWTVSYQRTDAWKTAQNIDPDYEKRIVNAAACKGIVHAASSLPIDDILKKQVDSESTQQVGQSKVEVRAKDEAQAALDKIESGITITQLAMTTVIPPRWVMKQFEEVQAAQSKKSKAIEQARTSRNDTLTQTAGKAADLVLNLIDRYERQLSLNESQNAAATLEMIDSVLRGEEITLDGEKIAPETSGSVTARVSEALQYRSSIVNEAKGEAAYFMAKLGLFRTNPLVMIHGDWTEAFGDFLNGETLQTIWLPPGTSRQILQINRDPKILADQIQQMQLKQATEAAKARETERARRRWEERTNTEIRTREQ